VPAKVGLSARYMKRFRCLASTCEATCCGGGAVPVEESTHRRLTVLADDDPVASALLTQGIELTPQGPGFARLRFLPSGGCSMLDQAGLCRIQSRFGHDALFDVCATYPRYVNEIDGEIELFGTLSCPEVARLVLLSDDGFEPEKLELDAAPRKFRNRFQTEHPYYKPFKLVRAALIRLLAEPAYRLSEKLLVLLWTGDKLRRVLHAGCSQVPVADLRAVLEALAEPEVLRALTSSFHRLALDASLPIAVISRALRPTKELRYGAQTELFDAILRELWTTYGRADASADATDEELSQVQTRYLALRAAVPPNVQDRIDVCLLRYAANHLLTTPYMLEHSLFGYAHDLVVRLSSLRFLLQTRLSGFSGEPAELDRQIVQVVFAFVRSLEHSSVFGQLLQLLDEQGLNGLPHALCFLAI
jgi:lysine-N-methylase